jgi:hypothetical protein
MNMRSRQVIRVVDSSLICRPEVHRRIKGSSGVEFDVDAGARIRWMDNSPPGYIGGTSVNLKCRLAAWSAVIDIDRVCLITPSPTIIPRDEFRVGGICGRMGID